MTNLEHECAIVEVNNEFKFVSLADVHKYKAPYLYVKGKGAPPLEEFLDNVRTIVRRLIAKAYSNSVTLDTIADEFAGELLSRHYKVEKVTTTSN